MPVSAILPPRTRAQQNERRFSALMRAAQNGDAAAYEKFLREAAPWIRNLTKRYRQSLNPSEIEDLVQDVLLSIHSARATYDPNRALMPWLWVIFRNRLTDRMRQYGRHAAQEAKARLFSQEMAADEPNGDFTLREYKSKLTSAINTLPRRQREAVELVGLKELSPAEASEIAGVSVGSIRVSLHRAILALRDKLA